MTVDGPGRCKMPPEWQRSWAWRPSMHGSRPTTSRRICTVVIDGGHYAWNYPYGANKFAEMHPGTPRQDMSGHRGGAHRQAIRRTRRGELVDTGEVEAPSAFRAAQPAALRCRRRCDPGKRPGVDRDSQTWSVLPLFGETQSLLPSGCSKLLADLVPRVPLLCERHHRQGRRRPAPTRALCSAWTSSMPPCTCRQTGLPTSTDSATASARPVP